MPKATKGKRGKTLRSSPGIPSPPVLSAEYLTTIATSHIHALALTVDLHKVPSLRKCAVMFGATDRTFRKPPPHILGGYHTWSEVLHGIRYYNELSPGEQQVEKEKARGIAKEHKEKLKENVDRLMASRPRPMKELGGDEGDPDQLKELTAAAAKRSAAAIKHSTAEDVIRKHEAASQPAAKRRKTTCLECGYVEDHRVLKAAKCELPPESPVCVQCVEGWKQWRKKLDKDARLANIYNQQLERAQQCVASSEKLFVDLGAFLAAEFGPGVASELVELEGKSSLSIHVMDIASNHPNNNTFVRETGSIAGAEWFTNGTPAHPNTFQLEENSRDAIFLKLPRAKDGKPSHRNFALLMNNGFAQPVVDCFAEDEMPAIRARKVGRRPGAASGVFQLGDLCLSFTPVTRKDTTLCVASGQKSVHMYAHYLNDSGETKKCNHGYAAMLINRMTTQQKRRIAEACVAYRHILEKEAFAYIVSIACLYAVGIPATYSDGHYFSKLKGIFASRTKGESARDCLWKWMCSTGEIRNHEACKCHVDGNSSHPYEILSLFHRSRIPRKDGFVYLPLDNLCIRVKCDKQSLASNFTCTPHVADPSRNDCNFSKVHGPIP